jgi:PAS domain-containing protein
VALTVDAVLNFDTLQHAKKSLCGSEESFRQIVDNMPAFVWCASPDGKLEYLNRRIVDYTAERLEDLVDFGWAKVLHPEDVEGRKRHGCIPSKPVSFVTYSNVYAGSITSIAGFVPLLSPCEITVVE